MRALIACVALAACATASSMTPAQRVAGCWVGWDATVMRWSEDLARPGLFVGSKTGSGATEIYGLDAVNGDWRLCQGREGPSGGARCWGVAQGEAGSLEGGRAFIDGGGDALRIAVIGDGPERVIFQGRRQRCR